MGLITQEQLDGLWNESGLRQRIGRFRSWLLQRGLYTHVSERLLQEHFYEVLKEYLVKGRIDAGQEATGSSRPDDENAGRFTTGQD
jgi:hypothetical protein